MIKAIFFDIDGTLVSHKSHSVPQSAKDSLEELREKGVKLFIATGRNPMWIPTLEEKIGFNFDGHVTINGQYCTYRGEVLHDQTIPVKDLEGIIPYMEEKKIACQFVELNHMYLNRTNEKVDELKKLLGDTALNSKVESTERIYKEGIYQICPYISVEEEEEYFKHLPGCKSVRWNPLFIDVIPETGGKDVGISQLLSKIGITREECMAFGDGGNDISMLQYVGLGVAMGNAGDDVKAEADFVTKDIDSDGIRFALKKYEII